MFLPIRTDYRLTRRPWANYAIIAANVLLFVAGYNGGNREIASWLLDPRDPQLFQFFSSMFLHAGFLHIAGNMVFLWVFGNAINDRFGHIAYTAFYLAGGLLAGIGYLLLSGQGPVLGASGAIAAVTGAYLVLLPRVRITVLVIFYFITTLDISSLIFVGFQVVWNGLMTMTDVAGVAGRGGGGVAYAAHSSGYLFGMVVAAAVLALGLLPRDPYDLLNLIRHRHRRTAFQSMVNHGYDPYIGPGPARPGRTPARSPYSRWVDTKSTSSAPSDSAAARELELRRELAAASAAGDLPGAAAKYVELMGLSEDAVLSRTQQLDVANYLMSTDQYEPSAEAYKRFLRHYGGYEHTGDIELMLGLIYSRYLHQYEQAEEFLRAAAGHLRDSRKVRQAEEEIQALRERFQ